MVERGAGSARKRASGGSFLIEDRTPEEIFTLEDLSPEQQQIAELASAFAEERIMTQIPAIEAKDYTVSRQLMRELGELGMLGVDVPEQYGGLGLDKVTSTLVTDKMAVCGSFSVTFATHVMIGTLPLVWYGTPAQKAKYLPKLATGVKPVAVLLAKYSAARAFRVLSAGAEHVLGAVLEGEALRAAMEVLERVTNHELVDLVGIGRKIASVMVEAGQYALPIEREPARRSGTAELVRGAA